MIKKMIISVKVLTYSEVSETVLSELEISLPLFLKSISASLCVKRGQYFRDVLSLTRYFARLRGWQAFLRQRLNAFSHEQVSRRERL